MYSVCLNNSNVCKKDNIVTLFKNSNMSKYFGEKCECCKSDKINIVYKDSFFGLPVLKCNNCFLHFIPISGKKDLKKYYTDNYWADFRIRNKSIAEEVGDEHESNKFLKIITKAIDLIGVRKSRVLSQYYYLKSFIKGNSLLEIGAGEGLALEFFEQKDFKVFGIEPSPKNVILINKKLKKGKCIIGFAEDLSIFNTKFDIIIMSHILEHTINCRDIILNISKSLSSDGILFIEVPNCENEKLVKQSINEPHVYHFTKKSLYSLVISLGYQVIKIDTFSTLHLSSKLNYFKYLWYWILKRDCYYPSSSEVGEILRIIIKNPNIKQIKF